MQDDSPQLVIIEQLSRDYDEKYRNLEKLISESAPEDIPPRLMALAEQTAARFRSAQAVILSLPAMSENDSSKKSLAALTGLFGAFDEMRILFHFLFENKRRGTQCKG